jgi:peptidyl-prolyl cis-trans isomerase D
MLKYMRTHATSWIIKVGLFFIIVVFAFYFGWGRVRGRHEGMVAEVNGQFITLKDYNQSYQNLLALYRARYKDQLTSEMIRALGLKRQALDELINSILLYQEGLRMNLRVSPEELTRSIQSSPFFQVGGKFSREMYLRLLRLNRIEPEDFEQMEEQRLLIDKVRNLILSNVAVVSEEEAREAYLIENERVNLEFIRVKADVLLEKALVSDAEVEEYFSSHRERFRIPEKANLQYMVFRSKDLRNEVDVSEEEIKAHYEANIEEFVVQSQVKARHILIRVPPDAGPEKTEQARKKAAEVLAKAEKGDDFAELAKQYSEGPTAKKGGDLGFFPRGRMIKEFEDAAFSLKPGELSPVVRTQFGFHVIKVEDVKEERVRGLDEVRTAIESTLRDQKARDLAERRGEEALYTLYKGGEMESVAGEYGLSVKETGFFSGGEKIEGIPSNDEVASVASSLKEGEISPLVEISKDFYIFRMTARQESHLPELKEVKGAVEKEVKENKAREKAESVAEEVLADLKGGKPMKEAAADKGLKAEETGLFKKWTRFIPKVGFAEGIEEVICSLSPEDPYADRPIAIGSDWVIIRFKEAQRPDLKKYESEERQTWERMFRYRKAEEAYLRWLEALRGRSKIEMLRDLAEL